MSRGWAPGLLCGAVACKIKIAFFSREFEVRWYVFKIRMCLLFYSHFFSCALKQTVIFCGKNKTQKFLPKRSLNMVIFLRFWSLWSWSTLRENGRQST